MGLLRISGTVRRTLGERTAAALDAGVGLPADAQCWKGGDAINLFAACPGEVALSVVVAHNDRSGGSVQVTLFSHRGHDDSRVVPYEEFKATASRKESSVVEEGPKMIVEGKQVL